MCRIDPARFGLTPRESDVVELIARGLEIKEIAHELGIGYHTAKMFIHYAKRKMNARNSVEVAILLHGGIPQSQADAPERAIEHAPAWAVGHHGRPRR